MIFIKKNRRGTAALLVLILLIPLLGLLAFSIDYGYLLYVKTELQRAADQAALAGCRELLPDQYGDQDLDAVEKIVVHYVEQNLGEFGVLSSDIKMGRYNPEKIYESVQLLDNGIFDTVQVTLRRDASANKSVMLFFARMIGSETAPLQVTSSAILQKARYLGPGTGVFPFGIEEKAWKRIDQGETASIYGSGGIEDENGKKIPGNWGTLDIGDDNNSTSDLSAQIVDGLRQSDLDALVDQEVIPNADWIDASANLELNGDTGLSAGLKHAVQDVEGMTKVAPIFNKVHGKGGNVTYELSGWTAVEVVDSKWTGSDKYVSVRKTYAYDKRLMPVRDLSNVEDVIEGAFTSPVLAQ